MKGARTPKPKTARRAVPKRRDPLAWHRARQRRRRLALAGVVGVLVAVAAFDRGVGWGAVARHRAAWSGQACRVVGDGGPGRLLVRIEGGRMVTLRLAVLPVGVIREQALAWGRWVQEHAIGRAGEIRVPGWVELDAQADVTGMLRFAEPLAAEQPVATEAGWIVVAEGVLPPAEGLPPERAYFYRLLAEDGRRRR